MTYTGTFNEPRAKAKSSDRRSFKSRNPEFLTEVAIQTADGKIHRNGSKSHASLRTAMGREDWKVDLPGDVPGFSTNKGRFLTRAEAQQVAFNAGQIRDFIRERELLSSDIKW